MVGIPIALALFAVAIVAGGIAALSGFGIGSLLTPLLALNLGMKGAVAVVAVPHAVVTAARLWPLRHKVDRHVLLVFGLLSAAGGLAGALLHGRATSPLLGVAFGCLIVFAGISTWTGLMARVRFGRAGGAVAGLVSGLFGGLVGNQGGIRAAAALAFDLPKESFVATVTAIGLIVDGVRLPVYLATEWRTMLDAWPLVAIAIAGGLVGTFQGVKLLKRLPETTFRKAVAVLLVLLGLAILQGNIRTLLR